MHDFLRSKCVTQMVVLHFDSNHTKPTNRSRRNTSTYNLNATDCSRPRVEDTN